MERFLRYTTQKEPALTASFLAAVLLAVVALFLDLTDEDLAVLGPIALILAGVVIRAGVFSAATVERLVEGEDEAPADQRVAYRSWPTSARAACGSRHVPDGAWPAVAGPRPRAAPRSLASRDGTGARSRTRPRLSVSR
jgi:hypothetical protein